MRVARKAAAPSTDTAPPCARDPELYAHDLLVKPPARSKVGRATWEEYRTLLEQARANCAGCPLFVDCMYRAVVHVDVDGYVGCTSPRERRLMRRELGISVEAEDFDDAAGVRPEGRPLDHQAVLDARERFPDDTFEQLAQRLGCSLSTIKRHMRRARTETSSGPARTKHPEAPGVDDVLDVFDQVVEADR